MDAHVRDCLVDGYESLIPSLNLPDTDDRHVLTATARRCKYVATSDTFGPLMGSESSFLRKH